MTPYAGKHYRSLLSQSYQRFMNPPASYESWSRADLIARLTEYDRVQASTSHASNDTPGPRISRGAAARAKAPVRSKVAKDPKPFDVSKQPRRKIALKFSYAGWEYGGLAFQERGTPLPTVEGTLFDALARLKLVDPAGGPQGCEWERCGRTDKGVSAAGQVVTLWVRTALGASVTVEQDKAEDDVATLQSAGGNEEQNIPTVDDDGLFGTLDFTHDPSSSPKPSPSQGKEEIHYISMLNKTLPTTIRVQAWSPVSDTFSARFACRSRHYKYFFRPDHLDLARMQEAASYLIGEHDFRNLHRLDPAKQLTTFRRRILRADISAVNPSQPDGMHVFDLEGTAFLYNQVRHIMAVLLLIGSGLESPSVIRALLNADPSALETSPNDQPLELLTRKPEYQMADALPLMLYACRYAPEELAWRTDGDDTETKEGTGSQLLHHMKAICERSQIHAALDEHFTIAASQHHTPSPSSVRLPVLAGEPVPREALEIPIGGGTYRHASNYIPLLKRNRLDPVEITNARWKATKGARKEERANIVAGDD